MLCMGELYPRLLYIYEGYQETLYKRPTPATRYVIVNPNLLTTPVQLYYWVFQLSIMTYKYYVVDPGYPNTRASCSLQNCRNRLSEVGPDYQSKYLTTRSIPYKTSFNGVLGSWKLGSILKKIFSYLLQTQTLIVITVVILHNYVRHGVQRNWLFENYGKLMVINNDEEDDTLMDSCCPT